ncbi:interleukin-15 receptor subunit alpha isoform X4 [Gouania willdenowi]|uniref:interleukin-15 receptor subunit alpha isoform X4 n=1 Tax=Gouania willdenowi TaxID=441366 RepID=UPI0010551740|nr:interleukin-15 receptor subunit alpha isoform X4 [Gouania willdenowi]
MFSCFSSRRTGSCRMDPGFFVSLLTVCLLGAVRCSGDNIGCPCPDIPSRDLTTPPSRECRQINSTFRYSCVDGYVRKAGTSNRVKCELKNGKVRWEFHTTALNCIEDPKRPKTQSPNSTISTESHNESSGNVFITTRATATPSSPKMKQDMSSSPSEAGGARVQTLSYVDPVIETKLKSTTLETTTVLKDYTNSPPEALTGPAKAAIISVGSMVIIIASIAISFILYRRCRTTSQQPTEEQVPMNRAPADH